MFKKTQEHQWDQTVVEGSIGAERDFTKYHIFVDSGSTFQSTNQIWGTSLQFMPSLDLEPGWST